MSLTYGRKFGKTVSKNLRAHTQIYNSIYLQSVLSFHYTSSATDFQHIHLEYSLSFGNLKHPNTPQKQSKTFRGEHGTHERPGYINLIKYNINYTTTNTMP